MRFIEVMLTILIQGTDNDQVDKEPGKIVLIYSGRLCFLKLLDMPYVVSC